MDKQFEDEKLGYYEQWLKEIGKNSKEGLEKPVTREEFLNETTWLSAHATEAKDNAGIAVVISICSLLLSIGCIVTRYIVLI